MQRILGIFVLFLFLLSGCGVSNLKVMPKDPAISIDIISQNCKMRMDEPIDYNGMSAEFPNLEVTAINYLDGTDCVLIQAKGIKSKKLPLLLFDFVKGEIVWEKQVTTDQYDFFTRKREKTGDTILVLDCKQKGNTYLFNLETGEQVREIYGDYMDIVFPGEYNESVLVRNKAISGNAVSNLYFLHDLGDESRTRLNREQEFIDMGENYNRHVEYKDDAVCLVHGDNLFCLNMPGREIWKYKYDTTVSRGTFLKTMQIVGAISGTPVGVNSDRTDEYVDVHSNVIVRDGMAIFSKNRRLSCLNIATKEMLWESKHSRQVLNSQIWLQNDRIFVLSKGYAKIGNGRIFNTDEPLLLQYDANTGEFISKSSCEKNLMFFRYFLADDAFYAIQGSSMWKTDFTGDMIEHPYRKRESDDDKYDKYKYWVNVENAYLVDDSGDCKKIDPNEAIWVRFENNDYGKCSTGDFSLVEVYPFEKLFFTDKEPSQHDVRMLWDEGGRKYSLVKIGENGAENILQFRTHQEMKVEPIENGLLLTSPELKRVEYYPY